MRHLLRAALVLFLVGCAAPLAAQVSITSVGTPFTQNFDTLPASGSATWTQNVTISGWYHARTGTGTTIVANDGSSNAGNLYSYGTGTATDRALGSLGSGNAAVGNLFWGVRLQNNTGTTITSLAVSYVGEQWRNSAAAAQTIAFSYLVGSPTVTGSLAEFQSAGTAVPTLDFTSPVTGGAAGALNGNLAANRVAISATISGLSIPNGTEVMLRWSDPDHTGADHGLSIDDFSVTANPGGGSVNLSINDVTLAEGDSGTTTFSFLVSLSSPAPAGGVTFDIATADGTATTADNDYQSKSLLGQTITSGNTSYQFDVLVNGDATVESNQTFFVNVTNVTGTGVVVTDSQGLGTINNDDAALTPIHDIQGNGNSSPLVSVPVTTRGIVTGVKTNGFFIQEPDASVDADPNTSEGIFVFTSSAPPPAAAVGNYVQVAATVSEFVPPSDPGQPPTTELTTPTVLSLSTGNPLPTAVTITATDTSPAGTMEQLERLEGMRVSIPSFTVVAPTQGSTNEASATAASNGVFFGVVTGVARPFRETGIAKLTPPPAGTPVTVPIWDENPELLRVDSDGLVGAPALNLSTGAILTNLVGPLDYAFHRYSILPDPTAPAPGITPGISATAVASPTADEVTIGSYNLERFFDDQPGGDVTLAPAAYQNRLGKASRQIRDYLKFPDILGVVEVEDLPTLQALAGRISTDAIAASQPDPQYVAFLAEGNDVGGIDVGFLVKTATVVGATPRVEVVDVVQEGKTTTWADPTGGTPLLNDRPPLRLRAIVHFADGRTFPVTVIVNHLRSLLGVADDTPSGNRVRMKRQTQAEFLANLVQARQTADATERIVLVGDFNAFEVNDGYADVMGTIDGTPVPASQVVVNVSNDLVNPDFTNLFDTPPPPQRYGYAFDGHAQNIDHVLVNAPLIAGTTARRVEHPRLNADFPQTDRGLYGASDVTRLSDHDPILGFFTVPAASADLSVTKVDQTDPILPGGSQTWTISVSNAGPDAAAGATLTDPLPPGVLFQSVTPPAGWTCGTTPAVGTNGTVGCTATGSVAPGGPWAFTLVGSLDGTILPGATVSNTATVAATTADANGANNSHGADTAVRSPSNLSATKTVSGTFVAGSTVTYTIVVSNAGSAQGDYAGHELTDVLPASLTLVSANATSGNAVATIPTNTVTWDGAIPASGSVTVTITATLGGPLGGTVVSNQATLLYDADGNGTNEASALSDDPGVGGSANPTTFTVRRGFSPVSPCRVYDSRGGSALAAGEERAIPVGGVCGLAADAAAVALNVTVTQTTAAGEIRGDAGDQAVPATSLLSFRSGATRANNALIRLAPDGTIKLKNDSTGTLHVVVDVSGYFR